MELEDKSNLDKRRAGRKALQEGRRMTGRLVAGEVWPAWESRRAVKNRVG